MAKKPMKKAAKQFVPVNAASMREALKSVLDAFDESLIGYGYRMTDEEHDRISALYRAVDSALSAPPRNCDVGTAVEQESRWRTNCGYGIPNCKHCKVYEEAKNSGLVNGRNLMRCDCRFIWAQMPYTEGGAE